MAIGASRGEIPLGADNGRSLKPRPQGAASDAEQKEKFGLVHALRGVAASWVVLFHASEGQHINQVKAVLPDSINTIFRLGDNGVAIFFALSGYVIAHSVSGAQITPAYVARFALRRSVRLDPPYWASILLVVFLGFIAAMVKSEPFALPSAGQMGAHLTYTQTLLQYPQINMVYWTLCYEVQFYLVLVLALMVARYSGKAAVGVHGALFAAAVLWGTGILVNPAPGLFLNLWHCFFMGVLAYWSHRSKIALAGLLVLILALVISGPSFFTGTCALTAFGLFAARRGGFMSSGLSWGPLMFLGTISYSLYLIHNPVTGASFYLLGKLGVSQGVALGVTLFLCILCAYLLWLFVERPSMNLAHRVGMSGRALPAASIAGALNRFPK